MTTICEMTSWLNELAPLELSEDWDNTGLLLGCAEAKCQRAQTCLTLSKDTVGEAVERRADLVVAHHPLPFRPLNRITTQSAAGANLWALASHGIAVYAPHTAWDSADQGINAQLAGLLELDALQPLIPHTDPGIAHLGAGRCGDLAALHSYAEVVDKIRSQLPSARPRGFDSSRAIRKVAIACGSGGSLLNVAIQHDVDLFLTGEATYHTCLEAEAANVSLLMVGHFASERFAMEKLAGLLQSQFPEVEIWPSQRERDPVKDY